MADKLERLSDILSGQVFSEIKGKLSDNQKAALVWRQVNGKKEYEHSCGVFLKKSKNKNVAPLFCVYVDNHAIMTEFSAMSEIYLSRLAAAGMQVSGIKFLMSRYTKAELEERREVFLDKDKKSVPQREEDLRPLRADEQVWIEKMVCDLPEPVKSAAERACGLIIRVNDSEHTQS